MQAGYDKRYGALQVSVPARGVRYKGDILCLEFTHLPHVDFVLVNVSKNPSRYACINTDFCTNPPKSCLFSARIQGGSCKFVPTDSRSILVLEPLDQLQTDLLLHPGNLILLHTPLIRQIIDRPVNTEAL